MGSICFPHISVICYWNCYCCWFESPKTCVTATATTTMSGTDLFYNHSNFQSSTQWFFFFSSFHIFAFYYRSPFFIDTNYLCLGIWAFFCLLASMCDFYLSSGIWYFISDCLGIYADFVCYFVCLFKGFPTNFEQFKVTKIQEKIELFPLTCNVHFV